MRVPVVLEVNNVTKSFNKRVAVKEVTFLIAEGEILGLIGPNGCGKTTLIRCITGLNKMDSGEIFVGGFNIELAYEKAAENFGGIIESPTLYTYMSGLANLKYFASLHNNIADERIDEVVEIVGLKDRIKDRLSTYSLGMKQRLGIAQALLHRPKLLILDEPTNGLDPTGIKDMRIFLRELAQKEKIGILISSHILGEMELLCDRVAIMHAGSIITINTIAELTKKATENVAETYFVKVNSPNYAGQVITNNFKTVKYEIIGDKIIIKTSSEQMQYVYQCLLDNNVALLEVSTTTKTLEDFYNEIIQKQENKKKLEAQLTGFDDDEEDYE